MGPNGCGKSNLCDAVSWVLGEQSAKSLRGSRMRDVIFGGTRTRPPGGLATVSLTLESGGGSLAGPFYGKPAAGSPPPREITVRRKLFRNGGSQYILNGRVVRLRDVRDLFLGTGLGPHHYAIIGQGRVGQLLSARAVDRRVFIEEAAGVTRFRVRHQLAERKLANATLNLERVHDILQEVRRQAASLKRQARRAEQYERCRQQLEDAMRLVFAGQFRRMEAERSGLQEKAGKARSRLDELASETDRMDAEIAHRRRRERDLEADLDRRRDELAEQRVQTERLRERRAHQAARITTNSELVQRAEQELKEAGSYLKSLGGEERERSQRQDDLESELLQVRMSLKAIDEKCAAGASVLAARQRAAEECRQRVFEKVSEIYEGRSGLAKLDEALSHSSERLGRARRRLEDADGRMPLATREVEDAEKRLRVLREQLEDEGARLESLRVAVEARQRRLETLRREVSEQRAAVVMLKARRESLQGALADRLHSTTAVRELLKPSSPWKSSVPAPLGVLADFLDVDKEYQQVVGQWLGQDLGCLVVGDWDGVSEGARLVREEFGGRAAFLVTSGKEPDHAPLAPREDGLVPLSSVARMESPSPGLAVSLPTELSRGYLLSAREAAPRLAERHPDLYFLTAEGECFHGNTVRVGQRDRKGPLVLRQRLRENGPRLAKAERRVRSTERTLDSENGHLKTERADLQEVDGRHRALGESVSAAERSVRRAKRLVARLEQDRVRSRADTGRQNARQADLRAQRAVAGASLEALERASGKLQVQEASLVRKLQRTRDSLRGQQERQATLRARSAALKERVRAGEAAIRRAGALAAERRKRMEMSGARMEQWRQESERLTTDNRRLKDSIGNGRLLQERLRERIAGLSNEIGASRVETRALTEGIRQHRERAETARREASELEVALARVQADLDHLGRDCEGELGEPISGVASGVSAQIDAPVLEDAQGRASRLRTRMAKLGPVNALSREEYREVEQRREFLECHEQDLLDAIRDTRRTMQEIDRTCNERFTEAFEAINVNFREIFATLFEGGSGEMRLVATGEPDGEGIEIVAQPPGKRLQNVALLSGGEKSLTVMALLMAAFRFRPSPFCILDEVDSQLDEANSVRLRRLLTRMAAETQLILITHSQTIMEAASTLYGITMSDPGVSRLVSVRMAGRQSVGLPAPVVEVSAASSGD